VSEQQALGDSHASPSSKQATPPPPTLAMAAQVPLTPAVPSRHVPLQQSDAWLHTSPIEPQLDDRVHTPFLHSCEQQLASLVHALPSVVQLPRMSGWQTPAPQ
jgi:hypothetical protein